MSPKSTPVNLAKDGLRRCRQPPQLKKSDKKKKKKKKKKKEKKLKLNDESEADKTLYLCYHEKHLPFNLDRMTYVVGSIKVSDLLSSSDSVLQFQRVGSMTGDDLPESMGCGLLGSQIFFAGGSTFHEGDIWQRDVYAFETKQQSSNSSGVIRKVDAKLLQAKQFPVMFEVSGKLYALSYKRVSDPPLFEVFDPEMGTWSAMPQPPFFERNVRYSRNVPMAYAITGTKLFVSLERCPVFCFDVSQPDREWRVVRSMCESGPFDFSNGALVLDLPGDLNKKIMFAYAHRRWYLGVYIMFLDENRESITRIADLQLPMLPQEFSCPRRFVILHLGGDKACLVAPQMNLSRGEGHRYPDDDVVERLNTRGVVIPFQFQVDINKIDKDAKNCLTLQFMPTRIIEFCTSPSTDASFSVADACFVL